MKKYVLFLKLLLILVAMNCITTIFAQNSKKDVPPSFYFETENALLSSTKNLPIDFDVVAMRAEDAERALNKLPMRAGRVIPVNFTTENSGEWTLLPNGQDVWRLCIIAEDAIAIMFNYDKFDIPVGGKLYIYNKDRSQVLGAYTEEENPQKTEYSTEFVAGDMVTLEYLAPPSTDHETPIIISGVVYGYNNLYIEEPEVGQRYVTSRASDPCEVNINCPEGDNWQDQKKGVVHVQITVMPYLYYGSASLINNTAQDLDPLILSAYHVFEGATVANVNASKYYFDYEYVNCSGAPAATPKIKTGATILVNIPTSGGSDGTLLRLNSPIDPSWGVFYNGWDRRNVAATSGVSIHHPDGDRKKISTFTTDLVSTNVNLGGGVITASNSGWRVIWRPTVTNHGVTEGGSSGSPIFNQNGLIVGTLTGGSSECTSPYSPDIYGKLSYHWDQMSNPSLQMKPYLDPLGTGVEFLNGIYTTPEPCDPAKNLTVTYNDLCEAVLTWEAPENSDNITFTVFRDGVLVIAGLTETTYTDDNDFNHKEAHTWSVFVQCTGGESEKISDTKDGCVRFYTVSLSANPEEGGTVSGDGEYVEDETVTVIATPNANYDFVNWSNNNEIVSTDSTYSFEITENITLVANFIAHEGIKETEQAKYFTLYPNPADNQLNIIRTNVGDAKIMIYNNIGALVQSQEVTGTKNVINIAALNAGIYFIRLIDGQNSGTQMFVKE
jgi:hypothetical protein